MTARDAFCLLSLSGALACGNPLEALGQSSQAGSLQLQLHLEKDTFFEDEPIFYLLKLTNVSDQTVWVSPLSAWSNQLLIRFRRMPGGEPVTRGGLELLEVVSEGYRGDSLAPGESFYHSWDLSHHGSAEKYEPWTGTRTLLAGEYKLHVTHLSDYRGAEFGEGDPGAIEVVTQVTVIPRDAPREAEFLGILGLFRRLGTFEESSQSKMPASAVRATLRDAEVLVRSRPESPYSPLLYRNLLDRLAVRGGSSSPPVPEAELVSSSREIRRLAAEQAPARISRLFLVLCEPDERQAALLAEIARVAQAGEEREARIADLMLEFVAAVSPTDIRASVHRWWRIGCT